MSEHRQKYVFPSSIWMMRTADGMFMYERMMKIAKSMTEKVDLSLNSIFQHLTSHAEWHRLTAIQNQSVITRQDHDKVGLLKDHGIQGIAADDDDAKQQHHDGADEDEDDLAAFIDSNLAVNLLTTTAERINGEFQGRVRR